MLRSSINLYASAPELVCYDGDGAPAPVAAPPASPPEGAPKTLTQAEFDKALAEDKRKHQTQYQKLEQQLQSTLESAKLTGEERTKLEESLEDVRKQLRTKEEQAKIEKKKLEEDFTGKLSAAEKRAVEAEKRWHDSTIERALRDAATAEDAFNSDIVVTVLRGQAKFTDGEQVMVDVLTVDPDTGEKKVLQMSPNEAIKHMKADPTRYGNLFKSGVVGGIGGSASGHLPQGGKIDIKNLTQDQYMKLRKENPAALGLA
jgi:hypothetical protein